VRLAIGHHLILSIAHDTSGIFLAIVLFCFLIMAEDDGTSPLKCVKDGCLFFGSEKFGGFCSGCAPRLRRTSRSRVTSVQSLTKVAGRKRSNVEINDISEAVNTTPSVPEETPATSLQPDEKSGKKPKVRNRCTVCKKKVGLLGFDCRCGGLFCSLHRADKEHDCQFDYKTLQRAQLAENNPQVIAEKVTKI